MSECQCAACILPVQCLAVEGISWLAGVDLESTTALMSWFFIPISHPQGSDSYCRILKRTSSRTVASNGPKQSFEWVLHMF